MEYHYSLCYIQCVTIWSLYQLVVVAVVVVEVITVEEELGDVAAGGGRLFLFDSTSIRSIPDVY